jgi:hypothetical protein
MAVDRLVAWHLAEVCLGPGHFRVYRQIDLPTDADRDMVWSEAAQVIRQRLADALLDHQITPADLGLDEVTLRYTGTGPIVRRTSGYGDICPLRFKRIGADGAVESDVPHCPHLSGYATAGEILDGLGGSYAQTGTGSVRRFDDLEREPELLIRSRAALAGLGELALTSTASPTLAGPAREPAEPHDPVHAAARMAWRLGQVEFRLSNPPGLSL